MSIRAEHAEGTLWDAATARLLWWVDVTGQRVHCFDPASGNDSSWATGGQPGGVVLSASGRAGRGEPLRAWPACPSATPPQGPVCIGQPLSPLMKGCRHEHRP